MPRYNKNDPRTLVDAALEDEMPADDAENLDIVGPEAIVAPGNGKTRVELPENTKEMAAKLNSARPVRFVTIKVPIVDLTDEERESRNMPQFVSVNRRSGSNWRLGLMKLARGAQAQNVSHPSGERLGNSNESAVRWLLEQVAEA